MSENGFESFLRDSAADYHRPPDDVPRDEMWVEIRRAREEVRGRPQRMAPWLKWGVGIAAALAIGVGIGRVSVTTDSVPAALLAAGADDSSATVVYDAAAREHFAQVEALLVGFRADARTGRSEAGAATSARTLLTTTRLLMGSPASEDAQLRGLLQDVELVLAQIAQYRAGEGKDELELIDDGIQQRGVLLRLSAAQSPQGQSARVQGAL
jgi:hypothetical protein